MHPSKSQGLNGVSPFLCQKYWHIIGTNVTDTVLSILHSGHMLNKMNHTHIVLIPKKDPKYWLIIISLGNVVSRILSKVIANRLKHILPNVISNSQSAFVPDQLITENTTIAYEILHRMRNKRRGKVGHMPVKLDISKVYDWVEWTFLKSIMHKLGFDRRWVQLAMETVTTTSYPIFINGEPKGLNLGALGKETHYLPNFISYVLKASRRCYVKQ